MQRRKVIADEPAQQPEQIADLAGGRDQFSELNEKIVR
jgi:hypothetical protein